MVGSDVVAASPIDRTTDIEVEPGSFSPISLSERKCSACPRKFRSIRELPIFHGGPAMKVVNQDSRLPGLS